MAQRFQKAEQPGPGGGGWWGSEDPAERERVLGTTGWRHRRGCWLGWWQPGERCDTTSHLEDSVGGAGVTWLIFKHVFPAAWATRKRKGGEMREEAFVQPRGIRGVLTRPIWCAQVGSSEESLMWENVGRIEGRGRGSTPPPGSCLLGAVVSPGLQGQRTGVGQDPSRKIRSQVSRSGADSQWGLRPREQGVRPNPLCPACLAPPWPSPPECRSQWPHSGGRCWPTS